MTEADVPESPQKNLDDRVRNRASIDRALRAGTRAALLRHKQLGQSIVVVRDGKIVVVPPDEIRDDESGADAPSR